MVKSINNLKLKMEFGLALVLRASKNQNFCAKGFSYGINSIKFAVSDKRA
jgi:hypothetical protein